MCCEKTIRSRAPLITHKAGNESKAQRFPFLQSSKSSFHAAVLPLFYRKTQNPRTERGVKQFITGNLIPLNEDFISMETVTKDPVTVLK